MVSEISGVTHVHGHMCTHAHCSTRPCSQICFHLFLIGDMLLIVMSKTYFRMFSFKMNLNVQSGEMKITMVVQSSLLA